MAVSEKKRRDITLGEMQDECKRRNRDCMAHTICAYRWYCDPILNATEFDSITPLSNDLTDPPRFNEQQMALLKGMYAVGVAELVDDPVFDQVIMLTPKGRIGGFKNGEVIQLPLHSGETIDLAELLGKDGAE